MGFWSWIKSSSGGGGPPGGIDCEAVLERLYEYIDEELDDPETVKRIREHLKICKRCYPQYRFEKAFLRYVSEHGRTSAPRELKEQVFRRILEEERRD